MSHDAYIEKDAKLSVDRMHRYVLRRSWDNNLPTCNFIGLNPSSADETSDDPTIRRCIGFSKSFGCGELLMTNIFSIRSAYPRILRIRPVDETNSDENNEYITSVAAKSKIVIAAWGTMGNIGGRDAQVVEMLRRNNIPILCLGVTSTGFPRHPLYLRKDLVPFEYRM